MPNIGQFVLHSMANPPLKAGDYTLQGRMDVAGGPTEPYAGHLRITSPRFSLPPDQILSTFPPANSEGAYESRLPQVALKRRTLPWERAAAPGQTTTPWLALVVIAEGEGTLSGEVPVAQCVTPGVALTGPNDVATGIYLSVTRTVVDKVFPSAVDLPLLCHVREVDIRDTELANGDDDGFLAVVLANRLPQYDRINDSPVRYLACLVNLEGQLGVLPPPPRVNRFEFDAAQIVFDVRALATTPASADADHFVMGGLASQHLEGGLASEAMRARAIDPAARSFVAARPSAPAAGKVTNAEWATATERIEQAALTAASEEASRVVRDVMLEGFRHNVDLYVFQEPVYRFPVLAHWSFTVSGTGGFESLMRALGPNVGLLGTAPPPPVLPPGVPLPPPAPRPAPEFTETGHVGLPHLTRRGEPVRAWYRGPLASHPTTRDEPDEEGKLPLAHVSDQLRRVVPDGREDLSLAAAFEIGRLLALSQPSVVRALLAWRADQFGVERARQLVSTVSAPASLVGPALQGRAADLGGLIGRQLVLAAAEAPGQVLAPSRPLVDAGRPLPFAREGGLEALLAEGFGFAADDVARRAALIGPVAALQQTAVPVAGVQEQGPLLEGPAVDRLRTSLTGAVDRLTEGALRPDLARGPASARRAPGDVSSPDALDQLIARAEAERGTP